MVYQGKASKGCLPCRERRTKCDLALPSCSQCIRKKRVCTGYRQEEDIVFRVENPHVQRKVKSRTRTSQATTSKKSTTSTSSSSSEEALALRPRTPPSEKRGRNKQYEYEEEILRLALTAHRPSRLANLQTEAVLHFLGHYNEKFFFGRSGDGDYMTPVLQADAAQGGPVADAIAACGLATLGSMKNSPELVVAGNVRKTKVLRRLQEQLRDPRMALDDTSVLTCLFLGSFEAVSCSGPESMMAYNEHLKGAVVLTGLRGREQLKSDVGLSLYHRMRGMIIMQSLQDRTPLPSYIVEFTNDAELSARDFEAPMTKLLVRSSRILSTHKSLGSMSSSLADEASQLLQDWHHWRPAPAVGAWTLGEWPPTATVRTRTNADEIQHRVWLIMAYLHSMGVRILVSDLLVEYAQALPPILVDYRETLASRDEALLNDALATQNALCADLMTNLSAYLDDFARLKLAMRTIGAQSLLWPLSTLLGVRTVTGERFAWCAGQAARIADVFGLRQAQVIVDLMMMGTRAAASMGGGGEDAQGAES